MRFLHFTENPLPKIVTHLHGCTQITQVEMFKTFMESNVDAKIVLITFVKLKPWYARPKIVCDTCCCRYHVELELYYETFLDFVMQFGQITPLLRVFMNLYLKYYVRERMIKYFIRNNASGVKNVRNVLIWPFLMLTTPFMQTILNCQITW